MLLRRKQNSTDAFLIAQSEDDVEALQRLFKAKECRGAWQLWTKGSDTVGLIDSITNLLKAFPFALAILFIKDFKEN